MLAWLGNSFHYVLNLLAFCHSFNNKSPLVDKIIKAPPIILNYESMHNVWGVLEWLGNTLIFLLAGLIFGTRALEYVQVNANI